MGTIKESESHSTTMANPLREYLLEELQRLADGFDQIPSKALMAGQGAFNPEKYEAEFGSWEAASNIVEK